jgi:hypothetical protein
MAQTCPQCQSQASDEANHCPSCGALLTSVAPPPSVATGAVGGTAAFPPYKFDAARWSQADRIAGGATLVLFISLFLPWFTKSFGFTSQSVNGLWHWWMWLSLILSIVIVAYLVLLAGWDKLPISQDVPHVTAMMIATIANGVLVLIAFVDKPGGLGTGSGIGWGFGAIIGLLAAIVAAAPYAIPQLRAKTM